VKTINISQDEAKRRADGGVGTIKAHISEEFLNKLSSAIETARRKWPRLMRAAEFAA
jgi:hypothetical protein